METSHHAIGQSQQPIVTGYFERLWEESWTPMKTVVDVVREPAVILDKDFRVMTANESFYRTFQVEPKETEGKIVYELGNGQWDIPELRKLLEDILLKNTFFKGFEVAHEFPIIGSKVMILNARRIYKEHANQEVFPPIILLAMEDVTEIMLVADTISGHAHLFDRKLAERTVQLEASIRKREKEINEVKEKH